MFLTLYMSQARYSKEDNAYGPGIYTDRNGQLAAAHAIKDANGIGSLFVCCALEGDRTCTKKGEREIQDERFHTGGDGPNGWITRITNDDWLLARYLVRFTSNRITNIQQQQPRRAAAAPAPAPLPLLVPSPAPSAVPAPPRLHPSFFAPISPASLPLSSALPSALAGAGVQPTTSPLPPLFPQLQ
jgi:hypothetical protein